MKTAEEKTIEVCKYLKLPEKGIAFVVIQKALKEQDRDTRHACAEAVIALHSEDFEGVCVVGRDAAHAACMNVKAV